MSSGSDEEKTEEPTFHRREKAREEGQVVLSSDLTGGLVFFMAASTFALYGAGWFTQMGGVISEPLSNLRRREWGTPETLDSVNWICQQMLALGGVICGAAWVLGALAAAIQAGPGFNNKPIQPKLSRLSFASGLGKVFSMENGVKSFVTPLRLLTVLVVSGIYLYVSIDDISRDLRGDIHPSTRSALSYLSTLLIILSLTTLVFGVVDYIIKKMQHEIKLKMSHKELKDEHKDMEGDGSVKNKMRQSRKESEKRKSLKDVPMATAIITNPTHFAVAVRYDRANPSAPIVVAKGADAFARQIIAVGKANGVPVIQKKYVARALFAMTEVGMEIPMELYQAVAEILAEVYRKKNSNAA